MVRAKTFQYVVCLVEYTAILVEHASNSRFEKRWQNKEKVVFEQDWLPPWARLSELKLCVAQCRRFTVQTRDWRCDQHYHS
ncbi:hypothetical protein OK016_29660 [Vibrio chagasii]|nr:hypothetical protein [Vibrio chagasii]